MSQWLIGVDREGECREMRIGVNDIKIGSDPSSDVVLDGPDVDARHARIVVKDNRFILVDMKSSSGTFLSGRRVWQPQVIGEGQRITIGSFAVWIADLAAAALCPDGVELPSGEELELLELIAEEPATDEPRLVYADYLMDRGDPRGEFISLQIELAGSRGDDASALEIRLRELALRVGDAALTDLINSGVRFERGFVARSLVLTPFRRGRATTAVYRLSPAVYEVGEQFGEQQTKFRAVRSTPLSTTNVAVIVYDDSSPRTAETVALNQDYFRSLIESPQVPRSFGLIDVPRSASPGLVIEWPNGPTWHERFKLRGTADEEYVRSLSRAGASLARAVAAIHAARTTSGPANLRVGPISGRTVIVSEDGTCFLVDLPRMFRDEGTLAARAAWSLDPPHDDWIPPETSAGNRHTVASDIYCLGARLATTLMRRSSTRFSEELFAICERARAPDPADRFATATDLAEALEKSCGF